MKLHLFIPTLIAVCLLALPPAHMQPSDPIEQWYRQAYALYQLENPTESSDSSALALFLRTARKAQQSQKKWAVKSLIYAGNIHQGYQRYTEANALYHRSIQENQHSIRDSTLYYEAFLYLGSSQYSSAVLDSAQIYFEKASTIAEKDLGQQTLVELDRLYNSLGAIYYESANYQQAKNYFIKALQYADPKSSDFAEFNTGIQSNIASCLMKLKKFDAALRIFQNLSPVEPHTQTIRQNMAHCLFELGQYPKALSIYQQLPSYSGYRGVVALTNMGRIFMIQRNWQEAESILDSAIAENRRISPTLKNKEEALAYLYRSSVAKEQGLLDEALTWINRALEESHLQFVAKDKYDLPKEVSRSISPITSFQILQTKASLLFDKFRLTKQLPILDASIQTFRKSIETANFIKFHFDNDEAKLFFLQTYKPTFNQAIEAAYEACQFDPIYLQDYLYLMEQYKGSVLFQNIKDVSLKASAAIPENVKKRENEIRQLLAIYTSKLNQADDEKEAIKLQEKYTSLQVELSRLEKKYEQDSNYQRYKMQYISSSIQLESVQKQAPANTAFLNYYVTPEALYGLVITDNKVMLKKKYLNEDFKLSFEKLQRELYQSRQGQRYDGYSVSHKIYRFLIEPFQNILNRKDRWYVIPDSSLYEIPFDALCIDSTERTYVMEAKTVSYHYSLTLLLDKSKKNASSAVQSSLSMAPFAGALIDPANPYWEPLPYSETEFDSKKGLHFQNEKASKAQFLHHYPSQQVIHLATHASVGSDSAENWIQFYPDHQDPDLGKLYLPEIYNLNLHQVDLITLSACETAAGTKLHGEGLLSLSRAFLYAGCRGVVSTLWKTDDQVSAYLMKKMYAYMEMGRAPADALHAAKKDLLKDPAIGAPFKTPNYWANFIYTGSLTNEIRTTNPFWHLLWIIPFLLLGWIRYQKRLRSKAESV